MLPLTMIVEHRSALIDDSLYYHFTTFQWVALLLLTALVLFTVGRIIYGIAHYELREHTASSTTRRGP